MMVRRRLMIGCALVLVASACGAVKPESIPTLQVTATGGPTLTGKDVSITSFRGRPVVLIFWASWCGPCHDEQPALNAAYTQWSPRGVVFLGVDLRDTTTPALAFQSEFKVPYPSIADTNATLAIDYRIPSAPSLVFLNAQGKVADVVLGALGTMSVADFNAELTTLLGSPATSA
jgi:cytochrome c biogenesis protein CcmG/thiol:disulfide interchange protein DsbE